MLKIRLKRLGAKKTPMYRIIVINSTTKREGKPIQELGHYNPKTKLMKLDKKSALDWIKKGAQPTDTVKYLIDNCSSEGALNYKPKKEKKLSKKAIAKLSAEKEAKSKATEEVKAVKEETAVTEEAPIEEKTEEIAVVEEPAAEKVKTAKEEKAVKEEIAEKTETPAEEPEEAQA